MKIKSRMLAGLGLAAALFVSIPAFADHVSIGVGIGDGGYGRGGYGGYRHGYYDHGYYGYPAYYPDYPGYYPYYGAPPTVVYAPAPQVVYAPAPVAVAAPVVNANPASPTYTNSNGQTCREYQSSSNISGTMQQTNGTACLQPDGSWRVVQ